MQISPAMRTTGNPILATFSFVNSGTITWSTHKQHTVAFSSMESEYMALSDAIREAIAWKQFFQELQIPSAIRPVPLLTDSQTALEISDNPAKYRQAKHIDVRYHAVRHYIHDGKIQIDYIPSVYQPADLFTKALETTKHQRFCHMIGIRNSYEAFDQVDWYKTFYTTPSSYIIRGGFLVSMLHCRESHITASLRYL